jgi:hypothetical protein
MNEIAILKGHTSPETAFVVEDWPYGSGLRCKMRFWLEFVSTRKGFRLCSQSTNPKKSFEVWNAPKKSTCCLLGVMVQYDKAEAIAAGVRSISWVGCSMSSMNLATLDEFEAKYGEAFGPDHIKQIAGMRAYVRAYNARHGASA